MSHFHTGKRDGFAVQAGQALGFNPDMSTDPGYLNGLAAGRTAAIEASHMAIEVWSVKTATQIRLAVLHITSVNISAAWYVNGAHGAAEVMPYTEANIKLIHDNLARDGHELAHRSYTIV